MNIKLIKLHPLLEACLNADSSQTSIGSRERSSNAMELFLKVNLLVLFLFHLNGDADSKRIGMLILCIV